jgi:negative regulator of flagellin synthesis FlgM
MDIKRVLPYAAGNVQDPGGQASKVAGDDKGAAAGGQTSDRVELSRDYKELIQAKKTMMANDEVRTEKIERVRDQLESGTYQIDAEAIAAKMLDEIF